MLEACCVLKENLTFVDTLSKLFVCCSMDQKDLKLLLLGNKSVEVNGIPLENKEEGLVREKRK